MFNKVFEELLDKGKALAKLTGTEALVTNTGEFLEDLKLSVLLRRAKKEIEKFYSDENFGTVRDLIKSDRQVLATYFTEGSLDALKAKYGKDLPKGADFAHKLTTLNFFGLYEEVYSQKHLYEKFPEKVFTDSVELARYKEVLNALTALEPKLAKGAAFRGASDAFKNELDKAKEDIKAYESVIDLLK